jgi:hypothetical protein
MPQLGLSMQDGPLLYDFSPSTSFQHSLKRCDYTIDLDDYEDPIGFVVVID